MPPQADGAAPDASAPLAAKLSWLFANVHPPDRGPYTYAEAARLIKARTGVGIAESYIAYLAKGTRDNPTLHHLQGLAELFGIPVGYLAGESENSVAAQLRLLMALRDARVQAIALRAVGVSDKCLDSVLAVLDQFRELEGLPPGSGNDSEHHP